MKTLLFILTISLASSGVQTALAQAKKPAPAVPAVPNNSKPIEPPNPTEPAAKPTEKPATTAAKTRPFPFNTTADELDPVGKSFTHINKDGKKVKLLVTDSTVFKGEATGKKFEDIKVGDAVNGSRSKLNDAGTDYEVVSITFVGIKTAKPAPKK